MPETDASTTPMRHRSGSGGSGGATSRRRPSQQLLELGLELGQCLAIQPLTQPPTKSSLRAWTSEHRPSFSALEDSDTSMEAVSDDRLEEKTTTVIARSDQPRERAATKKARVRFTWVECGVKDLNGKGSDPENARNDDARPVPENDDAPESDEAPRDVRQTTSRPESPGERRVCVAGLLASGKGPYGQALPRKMFGRPSSPLGPRGLSVVGGDIRTSIARSAAASAATSRRGAFEGKRLPTAFVRGHVR